jgi:quercetin dioxygenase-like cupin family protein
MDRQEFEARLRREGFEVVHGGQKPGHASDPHAHDFDVRIMVLGGEITVIRDGTADTFRAGEHCEVPAGCVHSERVGPEGVAYVYGKVSRPTTTA